MPTRHPAACTLELRLAGTPRAVTVSQAVIAGWTGRDRAAMEHHIAELAALGVKRPPRTPMFYPVSCRRLTVAAAIEVSGATSSGEVECVLLQHAGELWIGAGSDHTDREVEAYDVTVSKQLCDKPVAQDFWRYADVRPHWDALELASFIGPAHARTPYQAGPLATLLAPGDLIASYARGDALREGTLMFCGTLPALGGVRPDPEFCFQLIDPVRDRRISHCYRTIVLPRAC
jgi:hypothetical protein